MKIHQKLLIFCLCLLPYESFGATVSPKSVDSPVPSKSSRLYFNNPSDRIVTCQEYNNGRQLTCQLNIYANRTHPRFTPVAKNTSLITRVVLRGSVYVLGDDICNAFPDAEQLDLDNSALERILPGAFDRCTKATFIELNGNNIKHLPRDTFRFNQKLEKLHIKGSKLRNIDEWLFAGLFNLKELQLGDNYLTEFNPDLLKTNKEITYLNIGKNELLDVDEVKLLENLPKLRNLHLDNNHISCDRLQEIRDNLQGTGAYLGTFYNSFRKRFYLFDVFDTYLCVPRSTWLELVAQRKALKKGDSTYQVSIGQRRNEKK